MGTEIKALSAVENSDLSKIFSAVENSDLSKILSAVENSDLSKILSGVGENIALQASPTARDSHHPPPPTHTHTHTSTPTASSLIFICPVLFKHKVSNNFALNKPNQAIKTEMLFAAALALSGYLDENYLHENNKVPLSV